MKHLLCECVHDSGCMCLCVYDFGKQARASVTVFLEQYLHTAFNATLFFHEEGKSINKED